VQNIGRSTIAIEVAIALPAVMEIGFLEPTTIAPGKCNELSILSSSLARGTISNLKIYPKNTSKVIARTKKNISTKIRQNKQTSCPTSTPHHLTIEAALPAVWLLTLARAASQHETSLQDHDPRHVCQLVNESCSCTTMPVVLTSGNGFINHWIGISSYQRIHLGTTTPLPTDKSMTNHLAGSHNNQIKWTTLAAVYFSATHQSSSALRVFSPLVQRMGLDEMRTRQVTLEGKATQTRRQSLAESQGGWPLCTIFGLSSQLETASSRTIASNALRASFEQKDVTLP
jgi:hypothetical protein